MTTLRPRTLAEQYRGEILRHLPAVRDGDSTAIHDARVATRRLREVLPLLDASDEPVDDAVELVRQAGRALGRVRELDVMSDLLARLERRLPMSAAVTAATRLGLSRRQRDARRKMVKRLERLDLDGADLVPSATRATADGGARRSAHGGWRDDLREQIAARAGEVRAAVQHASGVYFPKRSHATRIGVKKLRYAVEVAHEMGVWRPPHLLQDLKKIQATLGDVHDAQVLLDHLDAVASPSGHEEHLAALTAAIRADIEERYQRYLARRERLEHISAACLRFAGAPAHRSRALMLAPLVAASAALPAGIFLLRQRARPAADQPGPLALHRSAR